MANFGYSGFEVPEISTIYGTQIIDGSVIWEVVPFVKEALAWQPNKKYYLNDLCNHPNIFRKYVKYDGEYKFDGTIKFNHHSNPPIDNNFSYKAVKVGEYPITSKKTGDTTIENNGIIDYFPQGYRTDELFVYISKLLDYINYKYIRKDISFVEDYENPVSSKFDLEFALDVNARNPLNDKVNGTYHKQLFYKFTEMYPYKGNAGIFQFLFNFFGYEVQVYNKDEIKGTIYDVELENNEILIVVDGTKFPQYLEKSFKEMLYDIAYIKTDFIFFYIYKAKDKLQPKMRYHFLVHGYEKDKVESIIEMHTAKLSKITVRDSFHYPQYKYNGKIKFNGNARFGEGHFHQPGFKLIRKSFSVRDNVSSNITGAVKKDVKKKALDVVKSKISFTLESSKENKVSDKISSNLISSVISKQERTTKDTLKASISNEVKRTNINSHKDSVTSEINSSILKYTEHTEVDSVASIISHFVKISRETKVAEQIKSSIIPIINKHNLEKTEDKVSMLIDMKINKQVVDTVKDYIKMGLLLRAEKRAVVRVNDTIGFGLVHNTIKTSHRKCRDCFKVPSYNYDGTIKYDGSNIYDNDKEFGPLFTIKNVN